MANMSQRLQKCIFSQYLSTLRHMELLKCRFVRTSSICCRHQIIAIRESFPKKSLLFHGRNFLRNPGSTLQIYCQASNLNSNAASAVDLSFENVIKPDINIDFTNITALEENIQRRKLNVDVKQLHSDYCRLREIEKEIMCLQQQRRDNSENMKFLLKQKSENLDAQKAELINRGKHIRSMLKQFSDSSYVAFRKRVLSDILQFPVDLHQITLDEDRIIAEFGQKSEFSFEPINHLTLGKNMNYLLLRSVGNNQNTCYLLNEAALLEHHLLNKITGKHLRSSGLQHIVCPHMVKAFVAEGCGYDFSELCELASNSDSHPGTQGNNTDVEMSKDQFSVLTGVSAFGFAAYLLAMDIKCDSLPLKYYSLGSNYSPSANAEEGMYSVSEAKSAAVFGVAQSSEEADRIFEEFSSVTISLYKTLQLPYRVVQVGASSLRLMEERRTDFYIWSSGFQRYFKSGELRLCNDYISRRLMIRSTTAKTNDEESSNYNYVHTVDGVILKIPTVIAALMENSQVKDGTCSLPKFR